MLIAGRIINGFCVGICSAQVPVYISELAPPSKRGRVVGAQQWAITWGILILFYISYGTSFLQGTQAFRIPWGLQMIPAVILLIGLMFMPESPRWLASKDRWEQSLAVLTLVHGKGNPNSPFVEKEMKEIREMVEFERQNSDVTYLELFKPHMINRTHIGVFVQIWSQLTGMNVMMYYITYIFLVGGPPQPLFHRHSSRLRVTNRDPIDGWSFRAKCKPAGLFDSVYHQRGHDHTCSAFR